MDRTLRNTASRALSSLVLCALAAFSPMAASAQSTLPVPANLSATADYNKVTLTWDRSEKLDTVYSYGFEGESFLDSRWAQKTTNTYDSLYSWFQYPTQDVIESAENYADWIHTGKKSAALLFDDAAPHSDGSSAVQDEWLILNAPATARYLNFYTYIDPNVLEYGADAAFPDHYYVKVSYDLGETWTELWDARYDSNGSDGWQFVTLFLGNNTTGNAPLVGFQAVGDTTNTQSGLYFSWVIDDIALLSAPAEASAVTANSQRVLPLSGRATHRKFTPSGVMALRKSPAVEDLGTECYNVYLDDKCIAKHIKTNSYTDTSDKTPGTHTYAVEAVSLSEDLVSAKAEVQVEIKKSIANAPKNVQLSYTLNKNNTSYDVTMTWEAPDGDRKPAYYNTYCNGALFGGYLTDLSVGQTNIAKGAYTYSVVAVYENPDGESDAVADVICVGTRNTVRNLTASQDASEKIVLSWDAPKASDYTLTEYAVYRGNELLGKTTQTTFTDALSPEGLFDYSVKVVYSDGVLSLPMAVSVQKGTVPSYSLPFTESFSGGLKPANWTVEKVDGKMKDNYLWRFDNWYDLPVSGNGFEGGFASVASSVAGYTNVFTTLDTPPILNTPKEGQKTYIEFDMDYEQGGRTSTAGLYYSYNGDTWAAIDDVFDGYDSQELTDSVTCKPEHKTYDITNCFPEEPTPVYFAWKYNGKLAHHLAIDNVHIYNTSSTSASSVKVGKLLNWRISQGSVVLSGCPMQRIQAYAANGICVADVNAGGATECSVPLATTGALILKVSTSEGTNIIKLVGKDR